MGGAMLRFAIVLSAVVSLSACAVTNTPYPRPVASAPQAVATPPNIYDVAARAAIHSELFACRNRGSNLGEIGYRGEAARYTPYMDTPAGALLRNPTEVSCLSSGFGWRGGESGRPHNGVDLANPEGGYIYAAAAGRIVSADYRNGFGNFIEIDHGDNVRTRYAHMSEIDPNLRPGDRIAAGTPMGRMGMTGNATGVHLHYEVMVDGLLVDPLHYGLPQPYQTTPVTQTFAQPAPIEPPAPITSTLVAPEAAPSTTPVTQSFPEPVRLRPPGGER